MSLNKYHPIAVLVYFASLIALTMITMHPILLAVSLFSSVISFGFFAGKTDLKFYIPIFVFISLINPFYSHNGKTVLFMFFDQRITFESFFYGLCSAGLIVSVIYWFKSFGLIFTVDKLTWILGKTSPKLCVVFSLALRFIPLLKEHAISIYNAQISMGLFDTKSLSGKLCLIKNIFSALVSVCIEDAVETADTMRARGYENKKRSAYSLVRFTLKDLVLILAVLTLNCIIIYLLIGGQGQFYYYPELYMQSISFKSVILYSCFTLLCFLGLVIKCGGELYWKYLISKI